MNNFDKPGNGRTLKKFLLPIEEIDRSLKKKDLLRQPKTVQHIHKNNADIAYRESINKIIQHSIVTSEYYCKKDN